MQHILNSVFGSDRGRVWDGYGSASSVSFPQTTTRFEDISLPVSVSKSTSSHSAKSTKTSFYVDCQYVLREEKQHAGARGGEKLQHAILDPIPVDTGRLDHPPRLASFGIMQDADRYKGNRWTKVWKKSSNFEVNDRQSAGQEREYDLHLGDFCRMFKKKFHKNRQLVIHERIDNNICDDQDRLMLVHQRHGDTWFKCCMKKPKDFTESFLFDMADNDNGILEWDTVMQTSRKRAAPDPNRWQTAIDYGETPEMLGEGKNQGGEKRSEKAPTAGVGAEELDEIPPLQCSPINLLSGPKKQSEYLGELRAWAQQNHEAAEKVKKETVEDRWKNGLSAKKRKTQEEVDAETESRTADDLQVLDDQIACWQRLKNKSPDSAFCQNPNSPADPEQRIPCGYADGICIHDPNEPYSLPQCVRLGKSMEIRPTMVMTSEEEQERRTGIKTSLLNSLLKPFNMVDKHQTRSETCLPGTPEFKAIVQARKMGGILSELHGSEDGDATRNFKLFGSAANAFGSGIFDRQSEDVKHHITGPWRIPPHIERMYDSVNNNGQLRVKNSFGNYDSVYDDEMKRVTASESAEASWMDKILGKRKEKKAGENAEKKETDDAKEEAGGDNVPDEKKEDGSNDGEKKDGETDGSETKEVEAKVEADVRDGEEEDAEQGEEDEEAAKESTKNEKPVRNLKVVTEDYDVIML